MVGQVAQTLFGRLGRTLEETATALEARRLVPRRRARSRPPAAWTTTSTRSRTCWRWRARRRASRRPGAAGSRSAAATRRRCRSSTSRSATRGCSCATSRGRCARAPRRRSSPSAVRELASAVWVLAALYEQPERDDGLRDVALEAARLAEGIHDREPVAADDADRRPDPLGRGRSRPRRRRARRRARGARVGRCRPRSCSPPGCLRMEIGALHVRRARLRDGTAHAHARPGRGDGARRPGRARRVRRRRASPARTSPSRRRRSCSPPAPSGPRASGSRAR